MKHCIKYIFISLLMCLAYCTINAQEQDSIKKTTDALFYYGYLEYDAEYYTIDSKTSFLEHHISYQPFISDINILSIELGIVNSFQEEGNYTTPSDLRLNYRRNFFSPQYGKQGYQGTTAGVKFIMPTGRSEYLSGFDSWSLEPIFGSSWRFENPVWSQGIQAKYFFSIASLPMKNARFDFLRLEYYIGFENKKNGIYFEPDYRYIPSKGNHNFFLNTRYNINANSKLGFDISYKYRVLGDDFFEHLFDVGFYLFL